jgi:hypothetical protein
MVMDPVHGSVDRGRCRSTMDRGQGLGGGSPEDGQNDAPVCGTLPRLRKKGEGMAVILIDCRRGQRRGGSDRATVVKKRRRKHLVRAALGCGEKRRGAGRGAVEGGDGLPLCRSRGGGDSR